jgi:hypothetical protein
MRSQSDLRRLYLNYQKEVRTAEVERETDPTAFGRLVFFKSCLKTLKGIFGLRPDQALKPFHLPVKKHGDVQEAWEKAFAEFQQVKERVKEDIRLDTAGVEANDVVIASIQAFAEVDTYCRVLEEDVIPL